MKRVRCPKCDQFIIFDERKYQDGQSLVFECTNCHKQFGIRLGASKLHNTRREDNPEANADDAAYGYITVIENVFGFKQVLPLRMGRNVVGHYQKGSNIECPIETADPSIDVHHCTITVERDKRGGLRYILRDGPSYTGTFVGGDLIGDREARIISDGTLFTIGATSIILHTADGEE